MRRLTAGDALNAERSGWASGLAAQPVVVLLLLAGVAALSYANTFHASFHLDDVPNIVNNSRIRDLPAFWEHTEYRLGRSRDVGHWTFAVNYYFGGLNVFGYHLVNLLIHITNGWLVYTFVSLLASAPGRQPDHRAWSSELVRGVALATALLFVAHPIQTQAVTYIVQRFASLATLFYLLALVCYLRWRFADPTNRLRYVWYAGALGSTILAMNTKEISFTLPFMLLLVEVFGVRQTTGRAWLAFVPFVLTLPIIPLAHWGVLGEADVGGDDWTEPISRLSYLFTQFRVIVTYVRLLVLPIHQNLDYDYPVYNSFLDLPVLLSFVALVFLVGTALYLLRRHPRFWLVGLGLLWFFLALSVESSIIPISDVIFEHRLYLPSVGFFLAVSAAVVGLPHRLSPAVMATCALVVVLLAAATYQRNRVWNDELTLWADVVSKSPRKARAYFNLGNTYLQEGRTQEAATVFLTAAQLHPESPSAHNNLGVAYERQGRLEEALGEYQTALRLKPDFVAAHNNLGAFYAKQGRLEEALRESQTALELAPGNPEAHNNLGNLHLRQGRLDEAMNEISTALELHPGNSEARLTLGKIYIEKGRPDDAIMEFEAALRSEARSPEVHAEAHHNLGLVYASRRQGEAAIQEYLRAIELKPSYAEAHYNLGVAYAAGGQREAAIQAYRKAIDLKPDLPEPHNNLGYAYLAQGRLKEASVEFQAAIQLRPAYLEAHYNLGIARSRQGRWDEAIQEFSTTLRLKPDVPEAEAKLGAVYAQQGRWDAAIAHYQRALQLRPDWVDVQFQLGQVYLGQGRVPEARRAFETAVRIRPDFGPAQQALEQLGGRS